jgi:hypothetical protein
VTKDQIKERLEARPFQPFTLRQADGREIRITHPEACAYRGGRTLGYMHPKGYLEVIDLLLVSSIFPDSPNGSKKRRAKGEK